MRIDPHLRIEPLARERRGRARIARGTLAASALAAVLQVDYRRRDRAAEPWQHRARVVVCGLGAAPRRTAPIDMACPDGGCRADLDDGVLTLTTAAGVETRRVVSGATR